MTKVTFWSIRSKGGTDSDMRGKWSTQEAVKWLTWKSKEPQRPEDTGLFIHDAFREALGAHKDIKRLGHTIAICEEPYHEHAHPIMLHLVGDCSPEALIEFATKRKAWLKSLESKPIPETGINPHL